MPDRNTHSKSWRNYLSLVLLFMPAILFAGLLIVYRNNDKLKLRPSFPYLSWQFVAVALFGVIATVGGALDWRFHRRNLGMKLPKKERAAEAAALGLGGLPMFLLMWFAMLSEHPAAFLVPILIVLIYTVAAISYDEFVFHMKRCGRLEHTYHRMLIFGNALAWLSWFHFIYCV